MATNGESSLEPATSSHSSSINSNSICSRENNLRKRKVEDQPIGSTAEGSWETVHYHRGKRVKKTPHGNSNRYPAITFSSAAQRLNSQIKIGDLRDLIVYIMADGVAPNWVAVKHRPEFRKVVVIVVPGLEAAMFKEGVDFSEYSGKITPKQPHLITPDDYYPRSLSHEALPAELQPFADMFSQVWPVGSPGDDKTGRLYSAVGTFLTTQLTKREKEEVKLKRVATFQEARTPITHFLTTLNEMTEQGYPIHPAILDAKARKSLIKKDGYLYTKMTELEEGDVLDSKIEQGSVTAGRHVLSVDCEMVQIGAAGELSLARISIIDWSGDTVMDELVKPLKPIVNYLTQYSGIMPEMLQPVTTTIHDIHKKLEQIITPRTILVGHSLESDLRAMMLSHPFTVDTSLIYPHQTSTRKNKLKDLTARFLKRSIQRGNANGPGHDSIEDARAALDLVRQKCEKGPSWGVPDSTGVNLFVRLQTAGTAYRAQGGPVATGGVSKGKKSAVVDWHNETGRGYGAAADVKISCANDAEIEAGVVRAVKGDSDGLYVPGGGVDFVFSRLRELEFRRGLVPDRQTRKPQEQNSQVSLPGNGQNNSVPERKYENSQQAKKEPVSLPLAHQLREVSCRLKRIYDSLPPCTAFIVFSGGGDSREHQNLFHKKCSFEGRLRNGTPNNQLTVQWTDDDMQKLQLATKTARQGIGFIGVK